MQSPALIQVAIAPGELIDKITILKIKRERIADIAKRENVARELALLEDALVQAIAASDALQSLTRELGLVNKALWEIEDEIRICERDQEFGPRFIELARSVYRTNDARAALKRQINELLGSKIVEEKQYVDYVDNDGE